MMKGGKIINRSYSQVGECSEGEESISVDNSDLISTQVSVKSQSRQIYF